MTTSKLVTVGSFVTSSLMLVISRLTVFWGVKMGAGGAYISDSNEWHSIEPGQEVNCEKYFINICMFAFHFNTWHCVSIHIGYIQATFYLVTSILNECEAAADSCIALSCSITARALSSLQLSLWGGSVKQQSQKTSSRPIAINRIDVCLQNVDCIQSSLRKIIWHHWGSTAFRWTCIHLDIFSFTCFQQLPLDAG